MRKKQLWQLLNDNKRDLSVKKPVKRWLRVVCKAFNGKSIYNDYRELVEGLKSDLTIYFTPANKFTRKQLKGLTASDLIEMQQRAEERDRKRKEVLSQNDKSNLTSVTNKTNVDNGFVNWFDPVGEQQSPSKSKCTFTDKYGNTVSLDDSYERLRDEGY